MSFIRTKIAGYSKKQRWRAKRVDVFVCDLCRKKFERVHRDDQINQPDQNYFCSRECYNIARQPGNISAEKTRKTCLEKFGTDNPLKNNEIRAKMHKTNLERHGDEYYSNMAQARLTCLNKFGVENPFQSEEIKEKIKKKLIQAHGADVDHPMKIPGMKEKIKKTMSEKYGVDHGFKTKKNRDAVSSKASCEKRLKASLAKKGKLFSSKAEDRVFGVLTKSNKFDFVKRWTFMNSWSIDMVCETNSKICYVQIDGIYWHGLDRKLEEIKQSESKRDKAICRKYFRDREQDKWFKKNGLILVRLTDKKIEKMSEQEIVDHICSKMEIV